MLGSRMLGYGGMLSCARRQDPYQGMGVCTQLALHKDLSAFSGAFAPRACSAARFCIPVTGKNDG